MCLPVSPGLEDGQPPNGEPPLDRSVPEVMPELVVGAPAASATKRASLPWVTTICYSQELPDTFYYKMP